MTDWRPIHEAHSIQVASLTVVFEQAMTDVPWRKVVTLGRTLAREFGLTVEGSAPSVSFALMHEGAAAPISSPIQFPQGVEFMRLRTPTFAEEKLNLDMSSVRYESWAYTRWAAFLDRGLDLILPIILAYYLPSVAIQGIGLDYNDRFLSAVSKAPDAGEIIDSASPLIPARAFRRFEPWHVHSGWFEDHDDQTKRLFNVDIDILETRTGGFGQGRGRALQLRTAAVDQFNQPGLRQLLNDDVTVAFLRHRLQMMHDELKQVLQAVLTDSASDTIGLKGGS